MTWREVKRNAPCLICGKPDWCGRSDDGATRCMRIGDPPAGWRKLKACPDGGTVFRPADEPRRDVSARRTASKPATARPARTFPTLDSAIIAAGRMVGGEHAGTWTYQGGDGHEVLHVARFNLADGRKQFRPFHHNGAGYVMGDPPGDEGPLPLYRLPDLTAQPRVFIVEGERCADAAASIGLPATTSAHGSKSAAKTDWQPLADREVVILPDADDAGEHYAETVASILQRLRPPATVRILDLPDLPPGGDICEFIEDRRTDAKDDPAIRTEIAHLADQAESIKPGRPKLRVEQFKPFPVHALPEPVRSFVIAGAKAIGCDHTYIALPLLSAIASVIGNARRIELKTGWSEPSVIWTAIVGESGTMKTPAYQGAIKPLRDLQRDEMQAHGDRRAEYERSMMHYEKDLRAWKNKGTGDPPKRPDEPQPARLIVSDITVEALAPILQANWRGLLLARDELGGWIASFDRYAKGRGADAAHWLSMFNADMLIVDRKTGPVKTLMVEHAAVSVTGGIQPGTLHRTVGLEHRENGLLARLLLAWPPRKPKKWTDAVTPPEQEARIGSLLDRLRELRPNELKDRIEPLTVRLTPEAKAAWVDFYDTHAEEQTELTGDLSAAWAKLEGYAARLALVVHYVRWAANDPTLRTPEAVDAMSVMAGATLSRWFGHEARRVYAILAESDEDRDHRQMVELIRRKGGSIRVRDWQRARSHKTSADAEAELKMLESAGYGTLRPAPQTGRGRPSKVFTLHPDTTDTDKNPLAGSDSGIASVSEASEGWSRRENHP